MKYRLMLLSFVCLLSFGFVGSASAGPLGVGVTVGGLGYGGHVSYQVSNKFELGAQVGLGMLTAEGATAAYLGLAPYGRLMLGGSKNLSPFIKGQLDIVAGGASYDGYSASSGAGLALEGSFGLRTMVDSKLAISGEVTLLSISIGDYTLVGLGTLTPSLWATWYF